MPVAQALRKSPIRLHKQPNWSQREYDFDQDPLWHTEVKPQPFEAIAWYHCDHLGTPMELTDEQGSVAWTGRYKAWGEVREERSAWAKQRGMGNPLRFQGQYHDHETGLHYNRYRYYDSYLGRFITHDPIHYSGGLNLYSYVVNPVEWIDPLGLAASRGRLQAQGKNLEESVSWNQETPLTAEDAKIKMDELKSKLSKKDLKAREDAFKKAEQWIENVCKCGGLDAEKSRAFMVEGTKSERVDIEIRAGKAFTGK